MDPSTPSAQDVHTQQADQQVRQMQSPPTLPKPTEPVQAASQNKMPTTISVNKEGQSASISESQGTDNEEVAVVPQETQTQAVQHRGADAEEVAEIGPSTPEFSASPEVENIVEASPNQEKPDLSKAVQDAGVTHSGPGVIDVAQNDFGVKKLPMTYQQAAVDEKKTEFKESKHWFSALIMYIWRKLNPDVGKEKKV